MEVQQAAERTVDLLGAMPAENWGAWMVHVLEALEGQMGQAGRESEFDEALNHVQHYLERRLLRNIE